MSSHSIMGEEAVMRTTLNALTSFAHRDEVAEEDAQGTKTADFLEIPELDMSFLWRIIIQRLIKP